MDNQWSTPRARCTTDTARITANPPPSESSRPTPRSRPPFIQGPHATRTADIGRVYTGILWQDGWTALIRAADKGHEAVVRLLIEHKAEVDAKTPVSLYLYHFLALPLSVSLSLLLLLTQTQSLCLSFMFGSSHPCPLNSTSCPSLSPRPNPLSLSGFQSRPPPFHPPTGGAATRALISTPHRLHAPPAPPVLRASARVTAPIPCLPPPMAACDPSPRPPPVLGAPATRRHASPAPPSPSRRASPPPWLRAPLAEGEHGLHPCC